MVTRFAPAPTGYLHLGHVLNAIYVWDAARAAGGRVLLRIEDHDRERCRPEFDRAILEDLDWLGFVPDAIVRQSDRGAIYEAALDELRAQGLVYACGCSRAAIAAQAPPGAPGPRRTTSGAIRARAAARASSKGRASGFACGSLRPSNDSTMGGTDRRNSGRQSSAATFSCEIASATGPTSSWRRWTTCGRG